MKIKVGINGMGRIGRMIVRSIYENKYNNIEIKHINNRTNSETCSDLLKYDSIHGKFDAKVEFGKNYLVINKKPGEPLPTLEREFLRYILSKEGQRQVLRDGYFPIREDVLVRQRRLLSE